MSAPAHIRAIEEALTDEPDAYGRIFSPQHVDAIRALLEERREMVEALEWYASMAKRMGNAAIGQDSQAMLTLMKEVSVDYGGRARAALKTDGKSHE